MGAEPYDYFVAYEEDVQSALVKLRAEVFSRGEFRGAEDSPSSPDEALEWMDADGTASILDIQQVTSTPDYGCVTPFSGDELEEYFGTDKPTRKDLETGDMFWDDLERGQARCATIYQDGQPKELYFVGYSFD